MTRYHSPGTSSGLSMFWMTLVYATLVIYGTLFPLTEWTPPPLGWSNPIMMPWPQQIWRADILINILAYLPVGLFVTLWLRPKLGMVAAIFMASAFGCGLSFVLEMIQSALPSRVPSPLDLAANSVGTLLGIAMATALDSRMFAGRWILSLRRDWFASGALANLGLIILGLWALTQTVPFVPSLDWDNIKSGLKPLGNTLRHPETFRLLDAVETGLIIMALGLLARLIALRPIAWPFLVFTLGVLILKVPVVGRQLTLESLAGWLGALFVLFAWPAHINARVAGIVMALLTAYALAQLTPGDSATTHLINWVPLKSQVGTLTGMSDILETLWPFMALALAVRWLTPWRWRRLAWMGGGLMIALLVFTLEWMQQSIPGRFADISDVVFAIIGWSVPWLLTDTRGRIIKKRPLSRPHTSYCLHR